MWEYKGSRNKPSLEALFKRMQQPPVRELSSVDELNAAIETSAELRFVSTMAERQQLSINLNQKFRQVDVIVSSIEVRDCDAKRPHEIQDKNIL